MQVALTEEKPILIAHQTIDHVRRAVCSLVLVALHELVRLGADLLDAISDTVFRAAAGQHPHDPFAESAHPLGEAALVEAIEDVPDGAHDLVAQLAPAPGAELLELQRRVQEAEHHCDRREERAPGVLGGLPAIEANALRGVVSIELLRLASKVAVALGEPGLIAALGDRRAEDAALRHSGGHVHLLAVESGVFLVRSDVLREVLSVFDGGPHHREAPQSELRALVEFGRASEDVSQRVIGNTPAAQVQRVLDVFGSGGAVGHDERWTDLESLTRTVDLDAAQVDVEFLGVASVVEFEAVLEALGEQLWVEPVQRHQERTESRWGVDKLSILFFTLKGQADCLASGRLHGTSPIEGRVWTHNSSIIAHHGASLLLILCSDVFPGHQIRRNQGSTGFITTTI